MAGDKKVETDPETLAFVLTKDDNLVVGLVKATPFNHNIVYPQGGADMKLSSLIQKGSVVCFQISEGSFVACAIVDTRNTTGKTKIEKSANKQVIMCGTDLKTHTVTVAKATGQIFPLDYNLLTEPMDEIGPGDFIIRCVV